jgi:hypothetical protein
MFAVIRHPDVASLGTCPDSALSQFRSLGWIRVSEWRPEPSAFHFPDFAEAYADLDATPEPAGKPARATKKEQQ